MRQLCFERHRLPADIVRHSIWLCARFTLELPRCRGEARRAGPGQSYTRPRPGDRWRLDEIRRRDAKAARRLMKKLLKTQGFAPSRVITDKLRSYPSAFRAIRSCGRARSRSEGQQQGRKLSSTGSPARRQTAKVQVTRLRATFSLNPLCATYNTFRTFPKNLSRRRV